MKMSVADLDDTKAIISTKGEAEHPWKLWLGSEEAAQARSILQRARESALPKFSKTTAKELTYIIRRHLKSETMTKLSESEIRDQIKSIPLDELCGYVKEQMNKLQTANADLQMKRRSGWRRATTGFQEFAETFDRFLKAYSGIVDLAQLADAQYGGVAFATLSLFFAVSIFTHSSFTRFQTQIDRQTSTRQ
jgi:hypothetical protein